MSAGGRVVLYDVTARPRVLPVAWGVGAALLHSGAAYGVETWAEAFGRLAAHEGRISELQVWSHGSPGAVVIGGESLGARSLWRLAEAVGAPDLVWFRSCDVARSHRFMLEAVGQLRCGVAAHTQVISAPNPLAQRGLVLLEPGELPTWPIDYDGATVGTLTMRLPRAKARRWRTSE